jgi:hypothetical protein
MPLLALVALAAAHLFDYFSFLAMVGRHGLGAEANPVVIGLVDEWGLPGLTLAKILAVFLAALVAVGLFRRRPKLALMVMAFGVLAGVVGGLSNVATF